MRKNKLITLLMAGCIFASMLTGCGNNSEKTNIDKVNEKVFTYGTTAYGPEMGNAGLNPHDNYSGWSTVRYGVGETLFKFNESMELEPWLATGYEKIDDNTMKINLRAPGDLDISKIEADGQSITITCNKKVVDLLNYLSDPYGAIIDMEYGVTEDRNVAGTGPFIAEKISDSEIELVKNEK